MFVAKETGQYAAVLGELPTDLPAVVDIRVLLADRSKGPIAPLTRTLDRCVVQFFMTEHQLRLSPMLGQVGGQPLLLRSVNPIAARQAILAGRWCRLIGGVIPVQHNAVHTTRVKRVVPVRGPRDLEKFLLGDVLAGVSAPDQIGRRKLLVATTEPAHVVIPHDVVTRTRELRKHTDVMAQRRELSVMHGPSRLPLGNLAAKVAQVDREIRFETLHLVNKLLKIRFVARRPPPQQVRIGIQTKT
jgi:hypothetical protein